MQGFFGEWGMGGGVGGGRNLIVSHQLPHLRCGWCGIYIEYAGRVVFKFIGSLATSHS